VYAVPSKHISRRLLKFVLHTHLAQLFMDFFRFSMMIAVFFLSALSVNHGQNIPTPPGVPVPVEALYGGPDNILQWYQVLSSDASPAACTALTNAKQTTDAALKPLTPWVLGKLSANGAAAPSTFNISVDSIDNSALVLRPLSGGASLSLRLVNVDTSIPGVTTLILTSFEQWNLVWMLSTSSSQLPQAYVNIWNNFRASLGAACSNCPKYTFPRIDNVAPVSQGSSTCNYPPGVSPSYVDADIQK
jgi:hypothetical protein